MKYSNPHTNTGRDSFQGHFDMGSDARKPMAHTQPHGAPDNYRHLLPGEHTHLDAVKAVKANAMQTYPAPARKPGTQATLQTGAPIRNVKALANMDDRTISQGEAIKRSVNVMGKNDCY